MQPQSGIKTWQWVVTAIVIIVLVIIGIMVFGSKKSEAPAATDTTPTATDTSTALNRIVMSDQYPGNVVYLSSVQLAQPGWVVIQSDNSGQPGAIIGSSYFASGINPGKITLTQPTVEGGTYYAVLYSGTNAQTFDATVEMPLKDSNGNVILHVFHASAAVGAGLKG